MFFPITLDPLRKRGQHAERCPSSSSDKEADLQEQIRSKAKELLADDQVQCVIGYEMGSRGQVRPAFVYEADDVERLVWNQGCTHNLVTYLHDKK